MNRQSSGQFKYQPFKDTTWSPVIFVTLTVLAGQIIKLVYTPPNTPISPLGSHVMASESTLAVPPTVVDPNSEVSQEPTEAPNLPRNPYQGYVDTYSLKYNVNPEFLNCIIFHESSYLAYAQNENSTATGLAQFLKGTWIWMRGLMKEDTNLDLRLDPEESIKTLAWAINRGYASHWQVVNNLSCKE